MADGKKLQPIIIKRVKKGGHSAHGGAWKIAYADFVTAMMAFFLLMWLLGSTSSGDLQGISAYFSNPVKVSLMGGDGTGNSDSILPGGGRDLSKSDGQVDGGDAERAQKEVGSQMARAELARQDATRIDALQAKITELVNNNPALAEFASQIKMEQTADGLQIQIIDDQNRPMFDVGSALVKPYMRDILREIGGAIGDVENRITLSGHTDATPYGSGDRGYSKLGAVGRPCQCIAPRADRSAGLSDDPRWPASRVWPPVACSNQNSRVPRSNRLISILLMTRESEDRLDLEGDGATVPHSPAPHAAGTDVAQHSAASKKSWNQPRRRRCPRPPRLPRLPRR